MNLNPFHLMYYAPVERYLRAAAARQGDALIEEWQEEAAEAALAGKPERAAYLEHMIRRAMS